MTKRLALALSGFLVLVVAGPSLAHVTVTSPGARQGAAATLTFSVPSEREVATTKVQVVFPADQPIPDVGVTPLEGWKATVQRSGSAVQGVTWTATGGGIKPDQRERFVITAGPLPRSPELVFKALQTYGDGEVVRWIEVAAPGAPTPRHPAPILKLAPGAPVTTTPAVTPAPTSTATDLPLAAPAAGGSSRTVAYALAVLGLLGVGAVVLVRRRGAGA